MTLLSLFYTFAKVGIFGFGGGPSMIPLIQEEVVDTHRWLTKAQFLDAFAFGSALPGPIATKMAGYVGYQVAGIPGAVSGVLGVMLPSLIGMIALGALYLRYRNTPAIEHFLKGVRPVVIALLALVVWNFAPKALGLAARSSSNWLLWAIAIVGFVAAVRFNVHPAILIVAGGLLGIAVFR